MSEGMLIASYIGASILFILSLGGLSHQETAQRGNLYGVIGMALAILVTILSDQVSAYGLLLTMVITGLVIGKWLASRVEMTQMPELIAVLHSFVGMAAVLVGLSSSLSGAEFASHAEKIIHEVEIFLGIFIGGVTFTGSIVAFGKLRGSISSTPLTLPGRHLLNLSLIISSFILGVFFISASPETALILLLIMIIIINIMIMIIIMIAIMIIITMLITIILIRMLLMIMMILTILIALIIMIIIMILIMMILILTIMILTITIVITIITLIITIMIIIIITIILIIITIIIIIMTIIIMTMIIIMIMTIIILIIMTIIIR